MRHKSSLALCYSTTFPILCHPAVPYSLYIITVTHRTWRRPTYASTGNEQPWGL